jgi:hypothetical protein
MAVREDSGRNLKNGFFRPEGWLFIPGTLAFLFRNDGFFRPDYAAAGSGNSGRIDSRNSGLSDKGGKK